MKDFNFKTLGSKRFGNPESMLFLLNVINRNSFKNNFDLYLSLNIVI